jgi:hypothetical protein
MNVGPHHLEALLNSACETRALVDTEVDAAASLYVVEPTLELVLTVGRRRHLAIRSSHVDDMPFGCGRSGEPQREPRAVAERAHVQRRGESKSAGVMCRRV